MDEDICEDLSVESNKQTHDVMVSNVEMDYVNQTDDYEGETRMLREIGHSIMTSDESYINDIFDYYEPNHRDLIMFVFMIMKYNDGAMMEKMLPHIQFDSFYEHIHNRFGKIKSNPIFHEMIFQAMVPQVKPDDKDNIQKMLKDAISFYCPLPIMEIIDEMWQKSDMDSLNELQKLRKFYCDLLNISDEPQQYFTIVKKVIRTGISRHVKVLYILSSTSLKSAIFDEYTRIKLVHFALTVTNNIPELPTSVQNHDIPVKQLSQWYDKLDFVSSRIQKKDIYKGDTKPIARDIFPVILKEIEFLHNTSERFDVLESVKWLAGQLCKQLKLQSNLEFEPILVGSVSEGTQTYFPDEYDFIFYALKYYDIIDDDVLSEIEKAIENVKTLPNQSCLLLETLFVIIGSTKYPYLCIKWSGELYKDMRISINIVSCQVLQPKKTLPLHNYLPVPIEHGPNKLKDSEKEPSTRSNQGPIRLYCEFFGNKDHNKTVEIEDIFYIYLAYSTVENDLIRSLPEYIREGYRIAKACRIAHVIESIVPPAD